MSSAPLALDAQKARSRAVISCGPGLVGQHVDVEGARGPATCSARASVSSSSRSAVMVLEDDDQIGQGLLRDLVGDPEVDAGVGGDAGHGHQVDVLDQERARPRWPRWGARPRRSLDGGERGQQRGVVLGPGMEPEGGPGDQGQGALGSDDQLGEVVPAGRLHELAAGADHLTGAQHRLDAQHVVAGHAVLDRPHAAGVGGHVAPQAGRLLAGEHRVDEPVGGERGVEFGQGHARVRTTATWLSVSISRRSAHPLERHHDAPGHRDARRPTGPVPDPRGVRGTPSVAGGLHDGGHLVGANRDAPRHAVGRAAAPRASS